MLQIVENEEKGPGQKIESEMAAHLKVTVKTIHVPRLLGMGNGFARFLLTQGFMAFVEVGARFLAKAKGQRPPPTLGQLLVLEGVIEASELDKEWDVSLFGLQGASKNDSCYKAWNH